MEKRTIVHMDLDAFFVEIERLKSPALRHLPLVVGGGGDRGVVAAASYEARAFGVHAGMPGRMARQLCPNAYFVRGDFDSYTYYSDLVTEVIAEDAPVLEKASIDEFYMDVSGMDKFHGCYRWALEVKGRVRQEAGLNISFGISENKTVSKVAVGEAKPNGQIQIPPGNERRFLAPLDVSRIPMVGQKTAHLLKSLGIQTVKTLSQMPIRRLEGVLGKNGSDLWHKANGQDQTPVVPWSARKSLSKENTFESDTIDVAFLRAELVRMVSELVYDLRQAGQVTGCITVKVRYANFDTHTQQIQIAYTCADHVLLAQAVSLFNKLYNRRLLVRLLGVRFSKLVPGSYQLSLFDESSRMAGLYTAMDTIRNRYGLLAVSRASIRWS